MGTGTPGFGRLSATAQALGTRPTASDGRAPDRAESPLIGMIRNPKSHRNRKDDGQTPEVPDALVAEPHTREELEQALAGFAERGIGVLAISGGDGTVRDVLTRGAPYFGNAWPNLIVLPQGKTNALAVDLGLPHKWSLEDALAAGNTLTHRPLVIEQRNGEGRPLYGFIFGAGVFNTAVEAGQVAHRYGAFQSFAVGVTAVFGVLFALLGFGPGPWRQPYGMQIVDTDEGSEPFRSEHGSADTRFLAGFTTLSKFPLGIRPFAPIASSKGIDYFFIDAPLRRAVALLPLALTGADTAMMRRLGVHRGTGTAFDINLDEGFVLDGEAFPAGEYRMVQGPELRFVVP